MKNFSLLFIAFVFSTSHSFSQAKIKVEYEGVTINNTSQSQAVDTNAVLDVNSLNKGVLFPRLTTEQRDQIENPTPGLFIYNATENNYEFFNGTSWMGMALIPGGTGTTGGGGPTPQSLSPDLWFESKVLPRTSWNTTGRQLNNRGDGVGLDGQLASGVALEVVAANTDKLSFDEINLSGDFSVMGYMDIDATLKNLIDHDANAFNMLKVSNTLINYRSEEGNNFNYTLDIPISTGNRHIAIVRSGTTLLVYADGILHHTELGVDTNNFKFNNIGEYYPGLFSSKIVKDILVFSEAKAAVDVADVYNNPQSFLDKANESTNELALGCFEAEGNDDPVIFDYSTNARHAQFSTTATSPYNPWVTGVTSGFQTALSSFNRYDVLTGELLTLDNQIDLPGEFDITAEMMTFREASSSMQFPIGICGLSNAKRILIGPDGSTLGTGIYFQTSNNSIFSTSSVGVGYKEKFSIRVYRDSSDDFYYQINGGSAVLLGRQDGDFSIRYLFAQTAIDRILHGMPISFQYSTSVGGAIAGKWTNFGGWLDEVGSNDVNKSATLNKYNIFGTAYNSTTDIFGNAFVNEWKEGMLNFQGGQHKGVNAGTGFSTTGDVTVVGAVYLNSIVGSVIIGNRNSGDGFEFGITPSSSKYLFRNEIGAVPTTIHAAKNTVSTGKWIFYALTRDASGVANFYIRDENGAFTLSGIVDQATGVPGAGSEDLSLAVRPTSLVNQFYGQMIPSIAKLGILTTTEMDQVVEYWKTNIINAAGN